MNDCILQRIEQLAKNEGLTITALERKIGASKGVLSRAIAKGSDIQLKWVQLIVENYPLYSTEWLITGEGEMLRERKSIDNMDVKNNVGNMIPLYEDVATIGGTNTISAVLDGVMPSSRYIDAGDWFKGATAAIRHYGDSMREYPSGCIIVIKEVLDKTQVVWGRNYCIETSEFRITKKLQKGCDPSSYTAYSTNTDTYPDGHLIHEPISIKVDNIRRLFLVMGCVIKEQSSGPVYIEDSI